MSGSLHSARARLEVLDSRPAVDVHEVEYRRLLGYPRHHAPGERADELARWARSWYAEHGRPWVYLREVELQLAGGELRLDGVKFCSNQLHDHLQRTGAQRAMLVAVNAGSDCVEHARRLWEEGKPDEYFFLEMFASAVVEHLVATLSGRICDLAEREGLMAVPHYSPGYAGWDVTDQNKLFELITRGLTQPFPEPMEVLASGMLRPKKSLLAVVGLAPGTERRPGAVPQVPCRNCSFTPCQYRRVPYRHAPDRVENSLPLVARTFAAKPDPTLARDARYTVSPGALRKWSRERVRLGRRQDGSVEAYFRFDGTTCSNLGQPLAFEYQVTLSGPDDGYVVLEADCRPVSGDEGHRQMCAYLSDEVALMRAISEEKPPLGRALNEVLAAARPAAPSGCYCSAETRAHKWGLALEAIHYTLAHPRAEAV